MLSNPERRALYDRFGHEGLRNRGFVPSFDLGDISDLFAAFFGDDLFAARGRRSRRGADVGAEVTIELVEAASGVDAADLARGRRHVRRVRRKRRRAGSSP